MEFTCIYLNDRLVPIWEQFDSLIFVKDFGILVIFIEITTKLKSIVLANSVNKALISEIHPMLEPKRYLYDVFFSQSLNQTRFFPMYIILCTKLTAVVIAPRENPVIIINNV